MEVILENNNQIRCKHTLQLLRHWFKVNNTTYCMWL